jgi:AcrR family transcriptional regulator
MTAAAKVFSGKGYANTRMEDVAVAAGVAVPTVYKTFRTKSALLLATVQSVMAETDSGRPIEEQPWWQEQIAAPEPREQLRLIARNARAMYERAGLLLEAVRAASSEDVDAKETWQVIDQGRRNRARMTAESLRAKAGLKPELSLEYAADTLHLLSAPELYTQYLSRRGASPRDYEAWLARVLIDALLV